MPIPGGKVYVTTELLVFAQSEAELAGVISHAVLSHSYQEMATPAKLSIFRQVPLVSTFARLALPQYSLGYERQANILGTRILSAAGYSANGLYTFMTRLAGLQG